MLPSILHIPSSNMAAEKLFVSVIIMMLFSSICHGQLELHKRIWPLKNQDLFVCNPLRFAEVNLSISDLGFCDKSLPYDVRAKDLVDRMTLPEKSQQLGNLNMGDRSLGLPSYNWWSEGLHGVSDVGDGTPFTRLNPAATSFPTVIHSTASFNKTLWNSIGKAISTEARAIFNLRQGGLTFWSPTMNPVRDPRWGRTTETPGEDPFVVGTYAVNFVRGMQDVEGHEHHEPAPFRPLKVASCCKHYTAYDIDNWKGFTRFTWNAEVTEQDMVETFTRPFEMCVREGDVSSVMCSYNQVNGIPTCADPVLLKQKLRNEWKLNGYIVSDCDSIQVLVENQHWLHYTKEGGTAMALKAGLDLDCGNYYPNNIEAAVGQGRVSEELVDNALKNLYVVLMRLGFFDGTVLPSLMLLGKDDICSKEHQELAAEASREGVVLLKNVNSTLPLNPNAVKTLAVIGPHANATLAMLGNYEGNPCHYVTPLNALSEFTNVKYEPGCNVQCLPTDWRFNRDMKAAVEASKEADATILLVGSDMSIEREGFDRENLDLPGLQKDLITQVSSSAKGPVILVVMTAGGYDISFAKADPNIRGILWSGHPGQEGGRGIADVVFGKYNPGGRLPITWYPSDYVNKIPMTSMPLRPVNNQPGRTYRFYEGKTVYPFGYGLSYTTFSYNLSTDKISVPIKLGPQPICHTVEYDSKSNSAKQSCPSIKLKDLTCDNHTISFDVQVENEGNSDGSEVILVYSKPPTGIVGTHLKQVVAFEKVFVPAKHTRNVKFELNVCKSLSIVDTRGYTHLPSGSHTIVLGTSSQQIQVDVSYTR